MTEEEGEVPGPDGSDESADTTEVPDVLSDEDAAAQAKRAHNRKSLIVLAVFLAVSAIVALVVVLVTGGGESEPAESTTTTTTEIEVEVLEPHVAEIATVKESVTTVEVLADEPDDWNTSTKSVAFDVSDLPPASGPDLPERDDLPRPDHPIVGRYAVEDGWEFSNPGPYEPKQPLTFLILDRRDEWTKVLIPVRPNHTEGWVRTSDIEVSTTEYRIEIDLSDRTLKAYDGDDVVADTLVVIGSPFTQTPTGLFYVTDKVPYENPQGTYGPIALATNGYSEWMDEFDTGVPVVAMHGTNKPELIGQAVSNGCIRVPNEIIEQLADTIPQGTPVLISP